MPLARCPHLPATLTIEYSRQYFCLFFFSLIIPNCLHQLHELSYLLIYIQTSRVSIPGPFDMQGHTRAYRSTYPALPCPVSRLSSHPPRAFEHRVAIRSGIRSATMRTSVFVFYFSVTMIVNHPRSGSRQKWSHTICNGFSAVLWARNSFLTYESPKTRISGSSLRWTRRIRRYS